MATKKTTIKAPLRDSSDYDENERMFIVTFGNECTATIKFNLTDRTGSFEINTPQVGDEHAAATYTGSATLERVLHNGGLS